MRAALSLGILILGNSAGVWAVAPVDDPPRLAQPASGVDASAVPLARSRGRDVVDLITHHRIEINRPPNRVWPFIVQSNTWTQLNLTHRGGPKEQVGELLNVIDPARPDVVLAYAENVELVANERRTFKVYSAAGNPGVLGGYVSWTLTGTGGRTVVSYDLFYETIVPDAEAQKQEEGSLARRRQEELAFANRKVQSELLALKHLVESK